jgi:NhaP-type Na+/H+ or K+/H+ antiporter
MEADAGVVVALALGAGVLCQLLARHLRMPSIVLLLAAGVLLGPDGIGWVAPRALGDGLHDLVGLAVAIILFEGALALDLDRIRRSQAAIRRLVTAGAVVTAVGGALVARACMGWEWRLAIVFGTLVIVTGPTVIRPLLRHVALRPRLATVLEAEGIFIDPVGAIAAAVTLELAFVSAGAGGIGAGLADAAARLGFGAAAGFAFGRALDALLRRPGVVPEGFENLVTLGGVLVLFEGCNAAFADSGILAVVMAGVVVGNTEARVARTLQEFEEHLTVGLLGLLFVLLAADVRLADVARLGWGGVATVAGLMALVRPANVLLSTAGSELDGREKAFLATMAPRGIVAAAVASLAALVMQDAGIAGGTDLRALVFLTIAVTVVLQGGGAPLVARLLRVRDPGRAGVAILGGEELALQLGERLRAPGRQIVILDANPQHCRAAQERGFTAVLGNALDDRVQAHAGLDRCAVAIGLTPNDELNSLFAREAREEFGVPETYVALGGQSRGVTPKLLEKQGSRVLFDGPKDVERWDVRFRHGLARIERFAVAGAAAAGPSPAEAASADGRVERFVVLAVERGGLALPMHADLALRAGDFAIAAVHSEEREAALAALAKRGLAPAPEAEPPASDG